MPISKRDLGGILVLVVAGRVDSSSVDDLSEAVKNLPSDQKQKILIDLTDVTHLDTKGVGQIIASHQDIESSNGKACWIVNEKQEQVRGVLSRTGLLRMLQVCNDSHEGFYNLTKVV